MYGTINTVPIILDIIHPKYDHITIWYQMHIDLRAMGVWTKNFYCFLVAKQALYPYKYTRMQRKKKKEEEEECMFGREGRWEGGRKRWAQNERAHRSLFGGFISILGLPHWRWCSVCHRHRREGPTQARPPPFLLAHSTHLPLHK